MKLIMYRSPSVLALLTMYLGLVHSWDVAVSVGDELKFYTNNTLISTVKLESQNLTALAYDEVHDRILYVDKQTNGDSICGYSISSMKYNCFTERSGRHIHGIALDPATDKVFFTDTNAKTVNWISLKPGSENNAEINLLITMTEGVPRDIVVDSCKGYVYWLITNVTKPRIERARFDGIEGEVHDYASSLPYNSTHRLEPHSLAFDQQTQTIYWFEPVSTTAYYLYQSKLNKPNKTHKMQYYNLTNIPMLKHPSNTFTVSNELIFSVDFRQNGKKVYIVPKTFNFAKLKSIDVRNDLINIGIVANYKIAEQIQGLEDCETLRRIKIGSGSDSTCIHGVKVDEASVCECTPGYTGERCEVSVCNNYCLRGNCTVNNDGLPECSCDAGNSGVRCEIDACHGFCLHGGDCSLDEEEDPSCQCVGSYEGTRCETYKSDTLPTTCYLKEINMTLGVLLSKLQKTSPKIIVTTIEE